MAEKAVNKATLINEYTKDMSSKDEYKNDI